ncbi:MAG: sugar-binding protein [Thermoflexales bacterium]|nr:sugar-binding protein [Thermoflexales bacterium]
MNKQYKFLAFVASASMLLAACGAAATPTAVPPKPADTPKPAAPAATAVPAATAAPVAVPAGKLAVGIVLPTKDEPRWIQDQTRFQEAFKAAGADVEILFSEKDSAKEKANVEALITKGIKVLILTPQDGKAAAAAAEAARKAGVKVIAYDRLILNTDAVDYYVTFDSVAVGEAWGQYLAENATGKGNNLYLYAGAASDNNAFLFFEGAWNKLQPKIADGTFVIKNSSEAVALQGKAKLAREEQAKIIGQVTTNWDFNTAKSLAEANLTKAGAADKGTVYIVAPNDGTARAIADAFAADKAVTKYFVTGQDAEKASVQYIIDGKQSMTVLKDVRTLVKDAITAALAYLKNETPAKTTTYDNGKFPVPAKPSAIVTVTKANVKAAIVDSGYYPATDFKNLDAGAAMPAGKLAVGIVLPTKDEPRWIQDQTRFQEAFKAAGAEVEILFSEKDSAKEKANVEALITKGVKVLILTPQDGKAAAASAEAARKAGVKVIAYDRLILNTDAVDYYVTFDSVAVGEAWGQYLVESATGKGNNLYLYAGAASDNNAFLFFEGAWNKLQPKIADGTFVIKNSSEAVALQGKAKLAREEQAKIIGQVTTNWDFNTAKSLAEANLTKAGAADKGTVYIVAPNDGTARAIADAFAADKAVTKYFVTGQDAEKASVQYIIDGKQSMTVLKDVRTLVKDAIAAALAYVKNETPAKTTTYDNGKIQVPAKPSAIVTVTKANVKAAIVDSGYYPASDFKNLP